MPVKSIQIKLHIPRTQEGEAIRKAAALTHVLHNSGVRWYMERLLELRQDDIYEDRDSQKPTRLAGGLNEMLLRQARKARQRNKVSAKFNDEQALRDLRCLYEDLIVCPSSREMA